jgi:hypothetical protein
MMRACSLLGCAFAVFATTATAAPIVYRYDGTATGDVFEDETGEFFESVADLPFVLLIESDTDLVDKTTPIFFASGTTSLSIDGSDFVEDDEPNAAVLDTVNNIIGQLAEDLTGFVSETGVPEVAGYELDTAIGPIEGIQSAPFTSTEILNIVYPFDVAFDGTVNFSFEATLTDDPGEPGEPEVIPVPASLPLLAGAFAALIVARQRRSRN